MNPLVTYNVCDGSGVLIRFEQPNGVLIEEPSRMVTRGLRPDTATSDRVAASLEQSLTTVKQFGARILESVRELSPSEANVEFGITFTAETGVIIAKSSIEGHVKISLTWKKVAEEPGMQGGS